MEKVVSNTSPIIHLAKIKKLGLLKNRFHKIIIPEEVYKECTVEGYEREEARLIKEASWIEVLKPENKKLVSLLQSDLDKGESEAIALALEIGADFIIIDDSDGRTRARHMSLKIIGTLGILFREKMSGNLPSLKDAFIELKETGFWISESLESRLLIEAENLPNNSPLTPTACLTMKLTFNREPDADHGTCKKTKDVKGLCRVAIKGACVYRFARDYLRFNIVQDKWCLCHCGQGL